MRSNLSVIVIGGLNTDIVALGVKRLLRSGEHTYAERLHIGPGGKSRNIAQMFAVLSEKKNVAMVGKTSKDPYGLWKLPVDSLEKAGVNTEYIKVVSFKEKGGFPGIALIPVDTKGRNQIYVIPGINNNFFPEDIDSADELFKTVASNQGMLILTLELPFPTALHAVKKANKLGIKVLFDPGGIDEEQNYQKLLKQRIFFLKPNEHEAQILTGVKIKDYKSAKIAAHKLLNEGVENVFITFGSQGGYLFNNAIEKHIPVPELKISSSVKDETGCGDQTMAAFAYAISKGRNILEAANIAILAGTLQFYKPGIEPITREELEVNSL